MNAPLSSGESIIAGRFCPRARSAVGTCLRNCKETGSAASGRPPVGKYFETSIREPTAKRGSTRNGSLVVKLMRRCILSSLCVSPPPCRGVLSLNSPFPVRPAKLRNDEPRRIYFFSTPQRRFLFPEIPLSSATEIKFIDFFLPLSHTEDRASFSHANHRSYLFCRAVSSN